MIQNGNKQGVKAAYAIAITLTLLLLISHIYLSATGQSSHRYKDPELSELLVRGTISDRNGELLAIQAPDYGFHIDLSTTSASYAASVIAEFTTEPALSIESRIRKGESFIVLPSIPSFDDIRYVEEVISKAGLKDNVQLTTVERRKYSSPASSSIIGTVDDSLEGMSGIERLLDSYLRAVPSHYDEVAHGHDVTLTISSEIQERLYGTAGNRQAAILENGEVIAFTGYADDQVLSSLVKSITDYYGNYIDFKAVQFPYETEPLSEKYSIYSEDDETRSAIIESFADLAL